MTDSNNTELEGPVLEEITETESKPILTLCLLTKQDLCALTSACFTNISAQKFDSHNVAINYSIGNSDLPKARSMQLSAWYKTAKSGDIFMFIDSDQTFTKTDIETSLYYLKTADIVCGAYSRRDGTMTLQPKDPVSFYERKEGELWFGATGFMSINYDIVHKLAQTLEELAVAKNSSATAYPFFYEQIVSEPDIGVKKMWLGEDFSFCWLARQNGAKVHGFISPTIGHILPEEKFVYIPKYTTWSNKSIVVYASKTVEPWSPDKLKTGIGGSELALIKLCPYWVQNGFEVVVYCNCSKVGVYDGVEYKDLSTFSPLDHFNILIGWRALHLFNFVDVQAKLCVVDLHDIVKPEAITPQVLKRVDLYFVKSEFHASMLPGVDKSKIVILSNGGRIEQDGVDTNAKDPNYIIYSSSYDRGLAYILKWAWPVIKKACPNAYFKLFYGWNGFDASQPATDDVKLYKDTILELMKQDGVMECGRVSQEQLLKEKEKASIHLYTGNFQEIDCISVRESACLGVIPVVSRDQQVFQEKSYCTLIDGDPETQEMQERAADLVVRLINDEKFRNETRQKIHVPASESWKNIAETWLLNMRLIK